MPYGALTPACSQFDVREPTFGPKQIAALDLLHLSTHGLYQTAGGVVAAVADDPVGQWKDLSGGGRHRAQTTAGSRPLLKFDELGGYPCLRFDGTDDFMNGPVTAGAALTLVLVSRKRSAPDATYRRLWGTSSGNATTYARSSVHATSHVYGSNSAAAQQVMGGTAAAWQILVQRWNSLSSVEEWQDGTALTAFDPHDAYAAQTTFGLGADASGVLPGDVDIAAVIRYTAALTNAQVNLIAGWLLTKYPTGLPAWTPI